MEGFNFGLEPAPSTHYEIGLKAKVAGNTRVNAAMFEIRTDEEIVVASSTNGRTSYQNAGKTLRRGFELGVQTDLSEYWQATLAYTRLAATYDEDSPARGSTIEQGDHLPGVAGNSLFAELVWKPMDGISMGFEGQYRGKVYVEDSNQDKPAPSYAVFNWRTRLDQRLGHWLFHELVRLDNVLDRQYVGSVKVADSNARYYEAAPGRSWYLGAGVAYSF